MTASRTFLSNVFGNGSIYEKIDRGDKENDNDNDNNNNQVNDFTHYMQNHSSDADLESQNDKNADENDDSEVPDSIMFENSNNNSDDNAPHQNKFSKLPSNKHPRTHKIIIDPKERALWKWTNVENLDIFLQEIYKYFLGNGIQCIILNRILNLLILAFVVAFSSYLTSCIDYSLIPNSHKLSDITISHCSSKMNSFSLFSIWCFSFFWIVKLTQYILDIPRLLEYHNFFYHLLEISENDMQTISWQQIVQRLMTLKNENPITSSTINKNALKSNLTQTMDAHNIANRIMRKENYLIALFNKDLLDLTVPFSCLGNKQWLTRTLEWNLSLCILDYVFNENGHVRPIFLKESQRNALSAGLRRRFILIGLMNIIFAPFILLYLALLTFFRYFNEYHKNPSSIGSRAYTPLAEWKFREYNELYHLFHRRLNISYEPASRYVDQFPKEKTTQIMRFVAFIAGAFAAVLALVSLVDPEMFLGFEITHDRTVLFYIGLFGTILAISRGMIPEETIVFDPEASIRYVAEFTHYLPTEWNGKLHSDDVRKEFCELYDLKVKILLSEIASIILTPFILWFSLPKCSEKIIDFFREYSVHVDGMGYVCGFALFDFKRQQQQLQHNNTNKNSRRFKPEYFQASDGKMLKSYLHFMNSYNDNALLDTTNKGLNNPTFISKQLHNKDINNIHGYTTSSIIEPTNNNFMQKRNIGLSSYGNNINSSIYQYSNLMGSPIQMPNYNYPNRNMNSFMNSTFLLDQHTKIPSFSLTNSPQQAAENGINFINPINSTTTGNSLNSNIGSNNNATLFRRAGAGGHASRGLANETVTEEEEKTTTFNRENESAQLSQNGNQFINENEDLENSFESADATISLAKEEESSNTSPDNGVLGLLHQFYQQSEIGGGL